MSFTKSALLGSAAVLAVVASAQAADLPSKKAAPATYVKICDTYGAGFFYIPGTDTCVKLGGYVRAEYNYTPGKDVYVVNGNILPLKASGASTPSVAVPITYVQGGGVIGVNSYFMVPPPVYTNGFNAAGAQVGLAQTSSATPETGYETRGRIDVDARTATSMGAARTFVRLRAANVSGVRNLVSVNNAIYTPADKSATGISIESAFVQWAGFTFGVAPENFSMMPSIMYGANPWTGFPNGMKQLSYTATLGGGLSATIALEDRLDSFNGSGSGPVGSNYLDRPATAANIVANVRLDQSWGFAAISGMIGNNSLSSYYGYNPSAFATPSMTTSALGAGPLGYANNYVANFASVPMPQGGPGQGSGLVLGNTYGTNSAGQSTFGAYAIGGTLNFKLPMIAAGDQIWFTANYAHGMLGAVLSGGSLNSMADASNHRMVGGIIRVDQPLMVTGGNGSFNNPYTVGTVNAWNVATVFTHYWAAQWRSNVSAGYVQINTPTSTATATDAYGNVVGLPQWGKGRVWEVAASLIYSPVKDFDIGLEVQYANLKNNIQNAGSAVCVMTSSTPCSLATNTALTVPKSALESNNFGVKLRVERSF